MLHRVTAILAVLVALAAGTAATASKAAAAPPSCPTGQACIVVTWHGEAIASGTKVFTGAQLQNTPTQLATYYPFCSVSGCPTGPNYTQFPPGTPIRDLIGDLGAGFLPESVRTLAISTAGRSKPATLTGNDLRADTDPAYPFLDVDGEHPYPAVFANGNGGDEISYFRPQRTDADANVSDAINGTDNGEIDIDIDVAGAALHPTITAPVRSVKKGGSLTFSASVPPGSPGGDPSYTWYLGDTEIGTGASLTHTFDIVGGAYTVSVKAIAVNASGQSSVGVTVGESSPPSTGSKSSPGRGTGTSAPVIGPTQGTGLHAGAPPSSAGPIGGSRNPAATGAAGSTTAPSAGATGSPTRSTAPQEDRGLVAIRGILLNPAAQQAVPRAQQKAGQPETAPASRIGVIRVRTVFFGAGLAASVLALLILGALGESRRPARAAKRRFGS